MVTLAAVLRAGAAYVPIDPEYPAERVAAILADATPSLLVTDRAYDAEVPVLRLDAELPDTETVAVNRPSIGSDTAYVIFTSGTTGRPKGVAVSHEAIVNRLLWMRDNYQITASDRILQKTPDGFDVSVWEFFLPLITGATVVVARDGGHKDPVYLAEIIEAQQVSVAHFVPSMLTAFLASNPDPSKLTSLRQVFSSGEALPTAAALEADRLFANASLHNLYGPTEAAVDVTAQPVGSGDTAVVPIGVPVRNTTTVVLDSWLRPVGPGVVGELYLAASSSPTATSAKPRSRPPGSSPVRTAPACTAPATSCAGTGEASSNTSAGRTIRSRSAASASSSTRSATSSNPTPR